MTTTDEEIVSSTNYGGPPVMTISMQNRDGHSKNAAVHVMSHY